MAGSTLSMTDSMSVVPFRRAGPAVICLTVVELVPFPLSAAATIPPPISAPISAATSDTTPSASPGPRVAGPGRRRSVATARADRCPHRDRSRPGLRPPVAETRPRRSAPSTAAAGTIVRRAGATGRRTRRRPGGLGRRPGWSDRGRASSVRGLPPAGCAGLGWS